MKPVRLQTLGRLALQNSNFRGEKALVLVTYLALEGPKTRAELAALLYGKQALGARDKLYALVRYLEKRTQGVIVRDPQMLRTDVSTDIRDFLDALRTEAFGHAEDLYQGYFLEGVALSALGDEFEAWALAKRSHLALQAREVLLKLGEQAAVNSFEEGARYAERAYLLHGAPEPGGEVFRRIHTFLVAGEHPLAATVQREAASFGWALESGQAQARRSLRPPLFVRSVKTLETQAALSQTPDANASVMTPRDRQLLLQRVRAVWLDGVLANMVDVPLELTKRPVPETVERPWGGLAERPYAYGHPTKQPLYETLVAAGQMLLLLGDAGAGKTVSLLQLTQSLHEQAEADPEAPLPVVFKLGSWTQGSLLDWLMRELETWYYIPAELGQRWLRGRQLLLLLDGLDEVAPSRRQACVDAINDFSRTYGPPGLVVASRTEVYLQAQRPLRLQRALALEPLGDEQVRAYLDTREEGGADAILADPHLRRLARNPAMLKVLKVIVAKVQREDSPYSVLATTPLDMSTSDMALNTVDTTDLVVREHVLRAYVQKMLARKGDAKRYPDEDTLRWLGWLALRMQQHGRAVFRLEDLQPDWLGTSGKRRCYHCAAVLVWAFVHFAVISLSADALVGVPGNLLLGGVVAAFVSVREFQERRYDTLEALQGLRWSWWGVQQMKWTFWLRWLGVTGVFGLLLTLAGGALVGESPDHLAAWAETLTGSLLFSVPFGLLVGLLEAGLKNRQAELREKPGRAVLTPAQYVLFGSLVLGLLGTLLLSPGFAYLFSAGGLPMTFAFILGGLIGASLGFWQFGGMTLIGHYVLRAILAASNRTPRNPFDYSRFLAYASSLTFLREVGGGYEFFHGTVQDYFAARYGEDD